MLSYSCQDCESLFNSQRKRKKCPICKSTEIFISVMKPQSNNKVSGTVVPSNINLFKDDLTEFKDEIKIGKKIYKKTKNEVGRSNSMVTVSCRKCGKKQTVNQILAQGSNYMCNDCIVGM